MNPKRRSSTLLIAFLIVIFGFGMWLVFRFPHLTKGGKPLRTEGAAGQPADSFNAPGTIPRQGARTVSSKASAPQPPSDEGLLGDTGRITTGAAEAAGLSEEERAKAQAIVDDFTTEMEASVKARMTVNSETTDDAKKTHGYKIKSLSEQERKEYFARYKMQLQLAVGDTKGTALFQKLDKQALYGSYGRYDVDVLIYPSPSYPDQLDMQWTTIDPVTHAPIGTARAYGGVVFMHWGDVFSGK